ncbi:MAG: hypothetical protein H6515_06520 [Microthrixaceae bacterium]|nr:hypothetical protein [Microthrixaceae bacterium]
MLLIAAVITGAWCAGSCPACSASAHVLPPVRNAWAIVVIGAAFAPPTRPAGVRGGQRLMYVLVLYCCVAA